MVALGDGELYCPSCEHARGYGDGMAECGVSGVLSVKAWRAANARTAGSATDVVWPVRERCPRRQLAADIAGRGAAIPVPFDDLQREDLWHRHAT